MIASVFRAGHFVKRDNVAARHLRKMPLSKHFLAPQNEGVKRSWREGDFGVASIWPEEDKVAAKFDLGRFLREVAVVVHTQVSSPRWSEQDRQHGLTLVKRNTKFSLTAFVSVPFLPTASFERRAA
jgi:hypothetical protein